MSRGSFRFTSFYNSSPIAVYQSQGDYDKAEVFYRRALAIHERSLGPNHPNIASSINNLASLFFDQKNYQKALPLYQRVLDIRVKTLGPDHPDVAASLNNLALVYQNQGRYQKALPLLQRALTIKEQTLGSNHPDVASTLNNLALLYQIQEDYQKALLNYYRVLDILEKTLGPDHPNIATSLTNLALLVQEQKDYQRALPLLQRALEIREKALGLDDLLVAESLENLAELYNAQGNYQEAIPLLQRALEIREKALGSNHTSVIENLKKLATLRSLQGDLQGAIESQTLVLEIQEQNLQQSLSVGSELQKRARLASVSSETSVILSLHLQSSPNDRKVARLALTTILRRKGRILQELTTSQNILRQGGQPKSEALLIERSQVSQELSDLQYLNNQNEISSEDRIRITRLESRLQQLEDLVSQQGSEIKPQSQTVTVKEIQSLIPPDTALVEFAIYRPFDPKEESFGAPRYAAYVLHADGQLQGIDLGNADAIDETITDFRWATRNPTVPIHQVKRHARELDTRVMEPVRNLLGNTNNILLSPDNALYLIPFEALVNEPGNYLVETHTINYLSSGQDLRRLKPATLNNTAPMVMGDPYFGRPDISVRPQSQAISNRSDALRSPRSLTQNAFPPLPGTREEAENVASILGVKPLTGIQATEAALKKAKSPFVLHVATHGFFFGTPKTISEQTSSDSNLLLSSGLVLAGVKHGQSGKDENGFLTALEVSNLNLAGTQLVVLSACDTGLGHISTGEGVYGLRRAFVMAGANAQLTSLWKVQDTATKDLMLMYYQNLVKRLGRNEALRQTKLDMLQSEQYHHPYYWASFIASGNWEPIDPNFLNAIKSSLLLSAPEQSQNHISQNRP